MPRLGRRRQRRRASSTSEIDDTTDAPTAPSTTSLRARPSPRLPRQPRPPRLPGTRSRRRATPRPGRPARVEPEVPVSFNRTAPFVLLDEDGAAPLAVPCTSLLTTEPFESACRVRVMTRTSSSRRSRWSSQCDGPRRLGRVEASRPSVPVRCAACSAARWGDTPSAVRAAATASTLEAAARA